jgi:hypothetical protein
VVGDVLAATDGLEPAAAVAAAVGGDASDGLATIDGRRAAGFGRGVMGSKQRPSGRPASAIRAHETQPAGRLSVAIAVEAVDARFGAGGWVVELGKKKMTASDAQSAAAGTTAADPDRDVSRSFQRRVRRVAGLARAGSGEGCGTRTAGAVGVFAKRRTLHRAWLVGTPTVYGLPRMHVTHSWWLKDARLMCFG